MIQISRRRFIASTAALVAAPAIIRVAKIMPIKAEIERGEGYVSWWEPDGTGAYFHGQNMRRNKFEEFCHRVEGFPRHPDMRGSFTCWVPARFKPQFSNDPMDLTKKQVFT